MNNGVKFWYQHEPTKDNFNESLLPVATVKSVEEFWGVYQHCKRPSTFLDNTYLYIFKDNIKPVWEDPSNQKGGAFVLRFYKNQSNSVWESIVLAFLATNINKGLNINGVRSKVKKDIQFIEVWVPDSENE